MKKKKKLKKDLLRNRKNKEELMAEIAAENFERRTLSFYRYVQLSDPRKMRDELFAKFDELGCKGRIYVATEGINAQMNVPVHNWDKFDEYLNSKPEFADLRYNVAREENGESFWRLTVKVKDKVVADGLDDPDFDSSNTGKYMNAAEVNLAIEDPEFLIVDMRNEYEAEVGKFDGAHVMEVDTFREQLAKVEEELGEEKDKKVLMYCTGGIRCEKASAWFKHKGFEDVYHVEGGVINYDKQVKEQGLESKFKGKNFVFDERFGERITDDIISTCHLCEKVKCDTHYNCSDNSCHILFIACNSCYENKKGYCSMKCRAVDALPKELKKRLVAFKNSRNTKYRPFYKKKRKSLK